MLARALNQYQKGNYYTVILHWYCNRRMPTSSHSNLTKPHYTSSWSKDKKQNNKLNNTTLQQHIVMPEYTLQEQPTSSTNNNIPAIQTSSSQGSASLAYSIDTSDAMNSNTSSTNNAQQQSSSSPHRTNIQPTASKDNSEANEYSIYSSGEMSAEQYYQAAALSNHSQYSTLDEQPEQQLLGVVNEGGQEYNDATPTVHNMHRKLLHLLSSPNLFNDAIEWQMKVDRGLDPSLPTDDTTTNNNDEDGMKSFDNEFNEDNISRAVSEQKDDTDYDTQTTTTANGDEDTTNQNKYKDQSKLIPPLPIQIFASDAEVVLPQALTASQLFGIERVSGIELEAAAGIIGLSQLFTRWLALMPEGDHLNIIDPPGLTVMKISGGRYRVTGAHRVVWRWMNCFSPASMFSIPSDTVVADGGGGEEDGEKKDTDFDFGDLVTMTIIDVFETDSDGKLLSYCPTFDNRAVHKTPETIERIRKGYQMTKERIDVVANSPAGRSVNKVSNVKGYVLLHVMCLFV